MARGERALELLERIRAGRHHPDPCVLSAERRYEPCPDERRLPAPRRSDHGHEAAVIEALDDGGHDLLPSEVEVTVLGPERDQPPVGTALGERRSRQTVRDEAPDGRRRPGVPHFRETDVGWKPAIERLGGRLVDEDLRRLGDPQQPGSPPHGLSVIRARVWLDVACDDGHAGLETACERARRAEAVVHRRERHDERSVPGRHDRMAPMSASDAGVAVLGAPSDARPSVREHEGDGPARQVRPPPAAQPLDEGDRGLVTTRRIGSEVRTDDPLQRGDPLALDRAPGRRAPGGRLPREQRHCGCGERVHVRRRRRSLPRGDLGCDIAGGSGPARVVVGSRGQSEIDEDDSAGRRHDHVGGLHVAVDDGRVVGAEVLERLGRLSEVVDDERRIQPGAAVGLEHGLEVEPLDPVHRNHVAPVHEEVLAHEWKPGMGLEREQEPRLGQELLPRGLVDGAPDLQRHLAIVDVVERPDHLALSAPRHDAERLVPLAEELGAHRGSVVERRSPSLTAPRATAAFASWTRRRSSCALTSNLS